MVFQERHQHCFTGTEVTELRNAELDVMYCRDEAVGNRRFFERLVKVSHS
jgi:hypothetical protein